MTDTHIRGTNPIKRRDDFPESLRRKLLEAMSMASRYEAEAILHGGDLFDRPDISPSVVISFIRILKDSPAPIYVVPGNHDLYGGNPSTLGRTMLGLIGELGLVRVIDPADTLLFRDEESEVRLSGMGYSFSIDEEEDRAGYVVRKDEGETVRIHMVHGMLAERGFAKGVPCTTIDDILQTEADITLTGHYHTGFGIMERDGRLFINPGAMARMSATKAEYRRVPSVALIEIEASEINARILPLDSALPGEDLFDIDLLDDECIDGAVRGIFDDSFEKYLEGELPELHEILLGISRGKDYPEMVREEALNRLAEAMEIMD